VTLTQTKKGLLKKYRIQGFQCICPQTGLKSARKKGEGSQNPCI
jgi:hypothetical protein